MSDRTVKRQSFLAGCLMDAVYDEHFDNIKTLIAKHKANGTVLVTDIAPIHYVAGMENIELAEKVMPMILTHDEANVNVVTTEGGETALHVAAFWGRENLVKMILDQSPNISLKTTEHQTAIHCAISECHYNVIQLFKDYVKKQKAEKLPRCMLTANGVPYNTNPLSPYYINVTHRRKAPRDSSDEGRKDLETIQLPDGTVNMLQLTEKNLHEFSGNLADNESSRRRISMIDKWCNRVNHFHPRTVLLDDSLDLSAIHLEACENLPFLDALSSTRQDSTSNDSFHTALESNFIRSPRPNGDFLYHLAEDYIHTDKELNIKLIERRISAEPVEHVPYASELIEDQLPDVSIVSTEIAVPSNYDTDALRLELTALGEPPGPIGSTTKRLYTKRLMRFKRHPSLCKNALTLPLIKFSLELDRTLRGTLWRETLENYAKLEDEMVEDFKVKNIDTLKLREGHKKTSFIYLLIDPRRKENLPGESRRMTHLAVWHTFLASIFYVGKGKNSRPYSHLYEAIKLYRTNDLQLLATTESNSALGPSPQRVETLAVKSLKRQLYTASPIKSPLTSPLSSPLSSPRPVTETKKLRTIIDIWKSGKGVICLHVFHNIIPVEAMTREAAIIDALGLDNLTNMKRGDAYGMAQSWNMRQRKQLGASLLYKAMQVMLADGEIQLRPDDI